MYVVHGTSIDSAVTAGTISLMMVLQSLVLKMFKIYFFPNVTIKVLKFHTSIQSTLFPKVEMPRYLKPFGNFGSILSGSVHAPFFSIPNVSRIILFSIRMNIHLIYI